MTLPHWLIEIVRFLIGFVVFVVVCSLWESKWELAKTTLGWAFWFGSFALVTLAALIYLGFRIAHDLAR